MASDSQLDVAAAHRLFSTDCFNRCWAFIDQPTRTADENEQMILLTMASLWHWSQRPDCTDQGRSIGHWQVSRALALAGQGAAAWHFGERCLYFATGLSAFYRGYGHEALARAARVLGDENRFQEHLAAARQFLDSVTNSQERDLLKRDLDSLQSERAK